MKLTTMTQVTLDGVMQGNGAASDDRRNGFERGGWARGAGDDDTRTFITQTFQGAEAFLFGRRTYELFAGSWGSTGQMRAHPIGVALNEAPKYVASTTLTAPHTTEQLVEGREELTRVLGGVQRLPEDRREALIMRFALGMDNREIARALGRSDGATKVLIHRAVKQLEGFVSDSGGEDSNE